MTEDVKVAIDHVVRILAEDLEKRKNEGIELERTKRNFWSKLKKRVGEEIATNMETTPTDGAAQDALKAKIGELSKAQNVKMSLVVFLYDQGIEL